jgi:Ca2+:H+ antiporter
VPPARSFGLSRVDVATTALALALTAAAGIAHVTGTNDVLTFTLAGAGLASLAWIVSATTEAVGSHFGPGITGVLQSTLGNLPELFVVLFALRAGERTVAETSILGSLFANLLLVLGLVLVVGARTSDDGIMRFASRLSNDTTMLLILASFTIALIGVVTAADEPAAKHVKAISIAGAVALLVVYFAWLVDYLRSDLPQREHAPGESPGAGMALVPAIVLLAAAGIGAALVSDWFIAALDPSMRSLGLSKAFAGLVIVAIAGNAVENVVGVVLAGRGSSDLAISVVKNSVAQIAAFLYPVLVLASLLFETQLTFDIAPVYIGALLLSALAVWQITGDGEATTYEGLSLISLYGILAMIAFYE